MAGEIGAFKIIFSVGDAATPTEAFTIIPGVLGVPDFPAMVASEIDVTALDSVASEFILGLPDPGTTSIGIMLRRPSTGAGWVAAQMTLQGYANDGILRGFKLVVKDGATTVQTFTWKGFVKSFKPSGANVNSAVQATLEIRNSGAVVIS